METTLNLVLEPSKESNKINLPVTFNQKHNENLYIALQSFTLNLPILQFQIGKVELYELDGFHSGLVQDKIFDSFYINSLRVIKERKVLDFIKLSNHAINNLSIRILDANGNPVKLQNNSYLTVRLKTMPSDYESFTIHVEKEGKNKISSFDYRLPYPINLKQTGTWKLALSSIILPNPNIGKDRELRMNVTSGNQSISWTYNDSDVWNTNSFISKMHQDIRRKLKLKRSQLFRVGNLVTGKFSVYSGIDMKLKFSNRLAYLIGYYEDGFNKAGREIDVKSKKIFEAPNFINLSRDIVDIVYVKCNQISPTILNNQFDHILKVVPIRKTGEKYFYYENEELELHDVLPTTLSHLNILLTDQNHLPLPYKSTRFDKISINFKLIHK